jgi:hypothetical protein
MATTGRPFWKVMRTISDIRAEIERASEDRAALLHRLSEGHDVVLAAELRELDARISTLWDEHREARAQARFGDRAEIIRRARLEERIDRAA